MLRNLQHLDYPHRANQVSPGLVMPALTPHQPEGRPSKLELMRADYQRRLLKEKEEKMVQLYQDNQKKLMTRVTRVGAASNGLTSSGSGRSERDSASDHRPVNGVGSADSLIRQHKDMPARKDWSSRSDPKVSAGRDRSRPLAPILRAQGPAQPASSPVKPGMVSSDASKDVNPFIARPRLVKHKPLPPTSNHVMDPVWAKDVKNKFQASPSADHKPLPRKTAQPLHMQQQSYLPQNPDKSSVSPPVEGPIVAKEKLTDFQKWQAEQTKTREDRLKRLNGARNGSLDEGDESWEQASSPEPSSGHMSFPSSGKKGTKEDERRKEEIRLKEQELLDMISNRQKELDRIRQERDEQENQEKRASERQKMKEAAERAKHKLEAEKQKKEGKPWKTEEQGYAGDWEEDYTQPSDDESVPEKKNVEVREPASPFISKNKPGNKNSKAVSQQDYKTSSMTSHNEVRTNRPISEEASPAPKAKSPATSLPKKSGAPRPSKSKSEASDPDERRLSLSDAQVYEQAAVSWDAQGQLGDLASCNLCGRSFLRDRLAKHEKACAKVQRPRKEFDSAKKRVEGTELAKYVTKKRPEPPKKKSTWRAKHEEFIKSLRYAKKVTQCEKEGGDLRNLTPPPVTENPDYVACPHCGRTFNESAAERHIPRCQSLKTRPPPMKTKRK